MTAPDAVSTGNPNPFGTRQPLPGTRPGHANALGLVTPPADGWGRPDPTYSGPNLSKNLDAEHWVPVPASPPIPVSERASEVIRPPRSKLWLIEPATPRLMDTGRLASSYARVSVRLRTASTFDREEERRHCDQPGGHNEER